MDQSEFEALLERGKSIPKVAQAAGGETPNPPAEQPPADGNTAIDFEALSGAAEAAGLDLSGLVDPEVGEAVQSRFPDQRPPEVIADGTDPTALDAAGRRPDGTLYTEAPGQEPGLGDASGLDAPVGGGLKSVFETKDFLFGDTPPEERSDFRKNVEDTVKLRGEQSTLDGVSAGIGQFAVAMFGLGKFTSMAKAVPWFGAAAGALSGGGKAVKVGLETVKAATAGAVAFDPWEARLSNLFAGTIVENPVTTWLAADPDDSEAEGRLKAALESVALDAVIIGSFLSASKVWKYLRKGDAASAQRVTAEAQKAQAAAIAREAGIAKEAEDASVGTRVAGGGRDVSPSMDDGLGPDGKAVAVEPPQGQSLGDQDPAAQVGATVEPPANLVDRHARQAIGPAVEADLARLREQAESFVPTLPKSLQDRYVVAAEGNGLEEWEGFANAVELWANNTPNADPAVVRWAEEVADLQTTPLVQSLLNVHRGYASEEFAANLAAFREKDLATLEKWSASELEWGGSSNAPADELRRHAMRVALNEKRGDVTGNSNSPTQGAPENVPPVESVGPAPAGSVEAPQGAASSPTGSPHADGASGLAVTPTPEAAAGSIGGDPINTRLGRLRVTDEDTEAVLAGMEADAKALTDNEGSFVKALEAGHVFGKGEGIPYEKLNSEVDIQMFMDRVVEVKQESIDRAKGGKVLTDERLDRVVNQMTDLFNEDPALVIGAIQRAGRQANEAVAHMETGFLITSRIFQDAHALAQKINLGDYTGYGNREGAIAELRKRLSVGASVYAASRSIVAASGRGVRRMRFEFSVDPLKVQNLMSMDGEELTKLVTATKGDPKGMARVADASWYSKGMNGLGWLLVNNLVSGPKTQLINLMSNAYMLGVRPAERMIGGIATGNSVAWREASKQYAYMGSSLMESFSMALKAFMRNDSVMNPHQTELFLPGQAMGNTVPQWQPWDSVGNITKNALRVATNTVGLPTRVLGTVDEAVKQISYRSKVMAEAHMEALERMNKVLPADATAKDKKAFVKRYVKDRVVAAFDPQGRALDANALREAQIATFQQELLPGSFGRTVQSAVYKHPSLRFVLPFVKTPTNVLRYGWKMTPGLNVLQTEYRQMLAGKMGPEAQSQAVGQMALGTLYMGAAAWLASQGTVTGGGPKQWATRSAMQDTGYQEYSIVTENDDGTLTYIPFNRYDPVAMPVGIIADLMDAAEVLGEETPEWQAAAGGLLYALGRQFTSKTYLMGVQDLMEVMQEPDPNKVQKWLGRQASNMIPYSAMMRQVNPDPYMREVRTMTDKLMATLPGFSEKVPMRYDWLGRPRTMRRGLWSTNEDLLVDNELVRLGMENDGAIPSVPQPVQHGVDLRDLTLSDGKNAYAEYQRLSGQPVPSMPKLVNQVAKMMQSKAYRDAPDGEIGTKGTRLWLLHKVYSRYREAAMKVLKRDPKVRDAFGEDLKKVLDHYSELRGLAPRRPKELSPLEAVGDAYNVDLGLEGQ